MGNKVSKRERRRDFPGDLPSFLEPLEGPSYFQRPTPAVLDPIDAEVLWFNPDKGFGFVRTVDGSEAFLHIRALEAAGHSNVPKGAQIKVTLQDAARGKQVSQVLEVLDAGPATLDLGLSHRPASEPTRQPNSAEQEGEGTVKWYNADKGFGFICRAEGGKDVFVHVTALNRSGMSTLVEGQRVLMSYAQGQKGLEARSIRPV
jgi:CspA family cold shock protein